MSKEKVCSCLGGNLDRMLKPAVLVCLVNSAQHGYQLLKDLESMTLFKNLSPDMTGLYRCLHEMEEDGLVSSEWDTPDHGRARRRFQITADGRDCLKQWNETLVAYGAALKDLCTHMNKALTKIECLKNG
jgi:DNA-binding PadR family transcriptional regulator